MRLVFVLKENLWRLGISSLHDFVVLCWGCLFSLRSLFTSNERQEGVVMKGRMVVRGDVKGGRILED